MVDEVSEKSFRIRHFGKMKRDSTMVLWVHLLVQLREVCMKGTNGTISSDHGHLGTCLGIWLANKMTR